MNLIKEIPTVILEIS